MSGLAQLQAGRPPLQATLLGCALLALPLLLTSPAYAQETRRVAGAIVDERTGAGLSGAMIAVENTNVRTMSGAAGRFSLDRVPEGGLLLRVTLFGFEELLVPVSDGVASDSLRIELQARPISIEGVDVVGSSEASLTGIVVDSRSHEGIPWARVRLGQYRSDATDESGSFTLDEMDAGSYLLLVQRLGYESVYVPVTLSGTSDPMLVPLEPDPILLQGIASMTERLDSRRGAYGFGPVRVFDEERLNESPARDVMELLSTQASVLITPCPEPDTHSTCVAGRGRPAKPRIFIDEAELQCGLSFLASYAPDDLFLVEVYDRGAQIRAYTREFMERTGRRNRTLIPADLLPPPMGTC